MYIVIGVHMYIDYMVNLHVYMYLYKNVHIYIDFVNPMYTCALYYM